MRSNSPDPILNRMQSLNHITMKTIIPSLLLALLIIAGCSDPDRPTVGLYLALQRGDIDQIERHIFWKADINKPGPNGQTPLHVAAEKGQSIITELLLKHGADINSKDNEGNSPLHTAFMNGRTQVAEFLIKHGAKFNPDQLLEESVNNNVTDRDVINMLLLHGADINHVSTNSVTPLLGAIKLGNRVLVKLLIASGADVNQPGNSGQTPLQLANQIQDDSVTRLLIKNGAVSK